MLLFLKFDGPLLADSGSAREQARSDHLVNLIVLYTTLLFVDTQHFPRKAGHAFGMASSTAVAPSSRSRQADESSTLDGWGDGRSDLCRTRPLEIHVVRFQGR